ncbi:MAG: GGDEF domain-containing protein [Bdellovibrionota bacterium]
MILATEIQTQIHYQDLLKKHEAQILSLTREVSVWRERAERDALTQCLRREAFMGLIESRREFGLLPHETTLVIVDIDFFKKVNDTYGHLAGDEALKHVAKILKQNTPEGGMLCRMGGEEFVMVLSGDVETNRNFLEALRLQIATSSCRINEKGDKISLTASFGAVTWNTDTSMMSASAQADVLLYRAKHEGRNRLVAA